MEYLEEKGLGKEGQGITESITLEKRSILLELGEYPNAVLAGKVSLFESFTFLVSRVTLPNNWDQCGIVGSRHGYRGFKNIGEGKVKLYTTHGGE